MKIGPYEINNPYPCEKQGEITQPQRESEKEKENLDRLTLSVRARQLAAERINHAI